MFELALSPKQDIGPCGPVRVIEWFESEIASGRRGAEHKGEESWPTIGFADIESAKALLGQVRLIRKGLLDPRKSAQQSASAKELQDETVATPVHLSSDASALLLRFNELVREIPETTEALRLERKRIGQDLLRAFRLRTCGGRCAVTGLSVSTLLRVSHIKPWARATDTERLNPANALLLAPHLDAVFDRGFATFSDSGHLVLSNRLSGLDREQLGLSEGGLLTQATDEQTAFLAWHRENVFIG
ncbi:HNH endonuclease [Caballeronia sp. HLA56]